MFFIFSLLFAIVAFTLLRAIYILNKSHTNSFNQKCNQKIKTLVILGSGGHTAEMIIILKKLNKTIYSPRFYVLAESDHTSETKVIGLENDFNASRISQTEETGVNEPLAAFEIIKVARSRKVGQSYGSSVWTTLWSILQSIPLTYRIKPNLILCNGPGTCVPICLIAFVFKLFFICSNCRIVFVESVCRTKTLSLSGKILLYFVDMFVVQWPQLAKISNRIKYFGRLT